MKLRDFHKHFWYNIKIFRENISNIMSVKAFMAKCSWNASSGFGLYHGQLFIENLDALPIFKDVFLRKFETSTKVWENYENCVMGGVSIKREWMPVESSEIFIIHGFYIWKNREARRKWIFIEEYLMTSNILLLS